MTVLAPHNTFTAPPEEHSQAECISAMQAQLQAVEELTFSLKALSVRYHQTLEEEGIAEQLATLERWAESYRRGLTAAQKMSSVGLPMLNELRDRMKLAAEEIQRLEDEGGNLAPSKEQAVKCDDMVRAVRRINELIPATEHLFSSTEPQEGA